MYRLPDPVQNYINYDTVSVSESFTAGLIQLGVFQRLTLPQQEILLRRLPDWRLILPKPRIMALLNTLLEVWQLEYTRPNYEDFDDIAIAAFEIYNAGYDDEKALHRLHWVHRIIFDMDSVSVNEGWRVSFSFDGGDRYHYTNDKTNKTKIIIFHRDP